MELIAIFKPGVAVNVKSYLERLQQTDPIILHIWESVGQRQSCTVCQNTLKIFHTRIQLAISYSCCLLGLIIFYVTRRFEFLLHARWTGIYFKPIFQRRLNAFNIQYLPSILLNFELHNNICLFVNKNPSFDAICLVFWKEVTDSILF